MAMTLEEIETAVSALQYTVFTLKSSNTNILTQLADFDERLKLVDGTVAEEARQVAIESRTTANEAKTASNNAIAVAIEAKTTANTAYNVASSVLGIATGAAATAGEASELANQLLAAFPGGVGGLPKHNTDHVVLNVISDPPVL